MLQKGRILQEKYELRTKEKIQFDKRQREKRSGRRIKETSRSKLLGGSYSGGIDLNFFRYAKKLLGRLIFELDFPETFHISSHMKENRQNFIFMFQKFQDSRFWQP